MGRAGNTWSITLNPEQRATVKALRLKHGQTYVASGSDGWSVYMMPSVGPARYVELRHRPLDGRVSRWVIEKDGSVSAHNDMGRSHDLLPVEAS